MYLDFMKKIIPFVLIASLAIWISACEKETETLQTAAISDYNPLVVGKYITYQLDSFVYTNFGTNSEIRTYQVKYLTEAEITDNLAGPLLGSFALFVKQPPIHGCPTQLLWLPIPAIGWSL